MSKAVLISIRPVWVEKIANEIKTVEVRKTKPNLKTPFKCYIYCTKGADTDDRLWMLRKKIRRDYYGLAAACANLEKQPENHTLGNGKVVAEFVCDNIRPLMAESFIVKEDAEKALLGTSLTSGQVKDYAGWKGKKWWDCKDLYKWHISKLEIYDAPKELNEFWFPPELYCEKERCGGCPYDQVADVNGEYSFDCEWKRPLTRPPQSWCYVEAME